MQNSHLFSKITSIDGILILGKVMVSTFQLAGCVTCRRKSCEAFLHTNLIMSSYLLASHLMFMHLGKFYFFD